MQRAAAIADFLESQAKQRPEYADLLALFIALYRQIQEEEETGIGFGAAAVESAARPLVNGDMLTVDHPVAINFLAGIVALLLRQGREGHMHLATLLAAMTEQPERLVAVFRAILARDRSAIDACAAEIGIPSPLLEFVMEIPLRTALGRFSQSLPETVCAGHYAATCPVCGSRAGMSFLQGEEGRRLLVCSTCSFTWPFRRLTCPYCGCDDPDKLSYFSADEGPVRVDICRGCSRYIKTIDSRKGWGDIPTEGIDLVTVHLELLAAREGFERGK